jgi:hypothetical protein
MDIGALVVKVDALHFRYEKAQTIGRLEGLAKEKRVAFLRENYERQLPDYIILISC